MSSFPDAATAASVGQAALRVAPAAVVGCARERSWLLVLCWVMVCAWLPMHDVKAHDIPNDVKLLVFVKPEAQQLTLLVRVPMAALREIDVPLRAGGFIDLPRAEPALRESVSVWLLDNLALYARGQPLPRASIVRARISLAADRSFTDYDRALAHLAAPPLADSEQLYWNQQLLDVHLQLALPAAGAPIAIEPRFARLGLRVALGLRYLPESGPERAYELHGDPGLVHLQPHWHQAAWRFAQAGGWHILEGPDHLLFLACLVIGLGPARRVRELVLMTTAFTVAHSITLAATAWGWGPQGLWFVPFVETLIAASIVWMALANILGRSLPGAAHEVPQQAAQQVPQEPPRWRWLMVFGFGLVHGFGFAFALRELMQFAGGHGVAALLAFNVGVEIGQLAALAVLLPVLTMIMRMLPERAGAIVLSALAAHTAWHWLAERAEAWWKHPLPRPEAADLLQVLAWATVALVAGIAAWSVRGWRAQQRVMAQRVGQAAAVASTADESDDTTTASRRH